MTKNCRENVDFMYFSIYLKVLSPKMIKLKEKKNVKFWQNLQKAYTNTETV